MGRARLTELPIHADSSTRGFARTSGGGRGTTTLSTHMDSFTQWGPPDWERQCHAPTLQQPTHLLGGEVPSGYWTEPPLQSPSDCSPFSVAKQSENKPSLACNADAHKSSSAGKHCLHPLFGQCGCMAPMSLCPHDPTRVLMHLQVWSQPGASLCACMPGLISSWALSCLCLDQLEY